MKYTLVDYFSYFFLRNATNFSNIRNTSFWFRSSWLQRVKICEISGSRRGVDEIRALLGYYAAYVGSFFNRRFEEWYRYYLQGPRNRYLARNVGKQLQTYRAWQRRTAYALLNFVRFRSKRNSLSCTENKAKVILSLTHIISLLSVIHTIYSIMQTKIQGLYVSTVYGHLQVLFLN